MKISNLGYVVLSVTNMTDWKHYATEVLGLSIHSEQGDSISFKMDNHPHRLVVQQGDSDQLMANGWELANEQAFTSTIKSLEDAGVEVVMGNHQLLASRCVTGIASAKDPAGNPFELYYGRTQVTEQFVSPIGVTSFVTGEMGMGHVVIPAPNIEEVHAFYTSVLGFGDSDDLHLPPPAEGAPEQRIMFMHANNPRHHSLALYNFPIPSGIVHMIFEVNDIDEVGKCLDRAEANDIALMASLGRHCNDHMLSFYMWGPGGIAVEYGCEGKQFDWDNFTPTVSTQGDFWGHAYQIDKVLDQ